MSNLAIYDCPHAEVTGKSGAVYRADERGIARGISESDYRYFLDKGFLAAYGGQDCPHDEKDEPVRRFAKGDKVLGPIVSRELPFAEVIEIYEGADGNQVLLLSYVAHPQETNLYYAECVDYLGDRKFIVMGTHIYRVSNGERVAESKNWANLIANFLETFIPPFPGDAEAESHDAWQAMNE